jgi:hypothetical protein
MGQNGSVKLTFAWFHIVLLTKHLKEVHGLMAKKAKPWMFSTSKIGL